MSDFTNVSIKDQNKSASSSLLKKNVRKFMRNKLAVFGLVVVVVIVGACVFGAVAGLDFNTPNPLFRKEPPSTPSERTPRDATSLPASSSAAATPSLSAYSARCCPALWARCWEPSPATSAKPPI